MPTPETTSAVSPTQARMWAAAMADAEQQPATRADIQALTAEIAALRELLSPPSVVILTGPEAMRAYERLRPAPRQKTAAQMRYDAAHDTSCVGAFARARP